MMPLFTDGNQLTGVIPSALAKLKNLQLLNLGEFTCLFAVLLYVLVIWGANSLELKQYCNDHERWKCIEWNDI